MGDFDAFTMTSNKTAFPPFPGESVTSKQLTIWHRAANHAFVQHGFGWCIESTPSKALLQIKDKQLPLVVKSNATSGAAGTNDAQVTEYLKDLRAVTYENEQNEELRDEIKRDAFAQMTSHLSKSMETTAPLKWARLLLAHSTAPVSPGSARGPPNPVTIFQELESNIATTDDSEDRKEHKQAVLDAQVPMPNGTTGEEYAAKVALLTSSHMKFMKNPLTGEELSDWYLDMVPMDMQTDKTAVYRELERDDMLDKPDEVYFRVHQFIKRHNKTEVKNAKFVQARTDKEAVAAAANAGYKSGVAATLKNGAHLVKGGGGSTATPMSDTAAQQAAIDAAVAKLRVGAAMSTGDKDPPRRAGSNKVPNGGWCTSGWCHFIHKDGNCWRNPGYTGPARKPRNPGAVERVVADRAENAQKFNVPLTELRWTDGTVNLCLACDPLVEDARTSALKLGTFAHLAHVADAAPSEDDLFIDDEDYFASQGCGEFDGCAEPALCASPTPAPLSSPLALARPPASPPATAPPAVNPHPPRSAWRLSYHAVVGDDDDHCGVYSCARNDQASWVEEVKPHVEAQRAAGGEVGERCTCTAPIRGCSLSAPPIARSYC